MRSNGGEVGKRVSPRAISVYNKYQLCKFFNCLPSQIDNEDAGQMKYFELMMGFENAQQRKKLSNPSSSGNYRSKSRHNHQRKGQQQEGV